MSLAEKLRAVTPRVSGCIVAQILADLGKEDREALVEALADAVGYSSRCLVAALREEGFPVGRSAIQVHRNNECSCVSA